jgi:hypothetical protein
VSQLVLAFAVGLPMFLAIALAPRLSVDAAVAIWIAGLLGSALAAWAGSAFGRRKELDWWFVGGACLVPAYMLLTTIRALFGGADSSGVAMVGSYAVGGLALCAGFWIGRMQLRAVPQA